MHKLFKFFGLVLAKVFDCDLPLFLFNVGILFLLVAPWKTLPWKRSFEEIQKHVTDCLQVVSPRLLVPNVGIDRGVSRRASQVLTVTEWYVLSI